MTITSAAANKKLKQLNDEYQFLKSQDSDRRIYSMIEGVEPIVPDYDMEAQKAEMDRVADEIAKIKHAVNVFNTVTVLPGFGYTIDEALVRMSFLTNEKSRLDGMRSIPKKKLVSGYGMRNSQVEYQCANFDPKLAEKVYTKIAEELSALQLALDTVNSTVTFEIN